MEITIIPRRLSIKRIINRMKAKMMPRLGAVDKMNKPDIVGVGVQLVSLMVPMYPVVRFQQPFYFAFAA